MIPLTLLRSFAPLLRLLPVKVASSMFYRAFSGRGAQFPEKFLAAPLRYAPGVRMRLKSTDAAHGPMAFVGVYEPQLTRKIWHLARAEGGTFLDVGANFGYFSLLWCAARKANNAVAVEASSINVEGLRYNIAENGFKECIEVVPCAASDKEGEVMFDPGPTDQTGWGGISLSRAENLVVVPCRRLDHQFAGRPFSVMKIDCEGADPLVLGGSSSLLDKHLIKHVFYEENEGRMKLLGVEPGSGRVILERHGYVVDELPGSCGSDYHGWLP